MHIYICMYIRIYMYLLRALQCVFCILQCVAVRGSVTLKKTHWQVVVLQCKVCVLRVAVRGRVFSAKDACYGLRVAVLGVCVAVCCSVLHYAAVFLATRHMQTSALFFPFSFLSTSRIWSINSSWQNSSTSALNPLCTVYFCTVHFLVIRFLRILKSQPCRHFVQYIQ